MVTNQDRPKKFAGEREERAGVWKIPHSSLEKLNRHDLWRFKERRTFKILAF